MTRSSRSFRLQEPIAKTARELSTGCLIRSSCCSLSVKMLGAAAGPEKVAADKRGSMQTPRRVASFPDFEHHLLHRPPASQQWRCRAVPCAEPLRGWSRVLRELIPDGPSSGWEGARRDRALKKASMSRPQHTKAGELQLRLLIYTPSCPRNTLSYNEDGVAITRQPEIRCSNFLEQDPDPQPEQLSRGLNAVSYTQRRPNAAKESGCENTRPSRNARRLRAMETLS